MNERSLEVRQVLWAIPKFLPATKFGTLILPTISVWCPIRAILVHRNGDSSLSYSHHSLSTQACHTSGRQREKNEQIYCLGQISSTYRLGDSIHDCYGEPNAPNLPSHHSKGSNETESCPGANWSPALASPAHTHSTVSRGASDAYVYYKVKTDCTVFFSFWKDNSGSPYLSELNICL